jgi:hypothetical protein
MTFARLFVASEGTCLLRLCHDGQIYAGAGTLPTATQHGKHRFN